MKSKAHKAKSGGSDPAAGAPTQELPERWSVQRKTELVLRLGAGRAWRPCRGRTRCRPTSSAVAPRLRRAGQARAADQGRAGGPGADPGARENRGADDALGAGRGSHRKKGLHGRVEEAQGMRGRRSPGTGRRYPLTMICATYRLARSSVYAGPSAAPREPRASGGRRPRSATPRC